MQLVTEATIKPGTKVFVRADIDVPIQNETIKNTFRLDAMLPTLNYLAQKKAHIVIAGHMGRPKGQAVPALSTKNLKPYFDKKLGMGTYTLLENLKFDMREEQGDAGFAHELAENAGIYVNECFSTSHHTYASIVQVPKYLSSFAGFRLNDEIKVLSKLFKLEPEKRPLTVIIGGAKLDAKLPVINKFLQIADYVLLGGLVGLNWQGEHPNNLYMPPDYDDEKLDIGSKTIDAYAKIIKKSKTVVWAGPLGKFEDPMHCGGTKLIAQEIAMSEAFWIAGGGDTITALKDLGGWLSYVNFVSTGGSAMLEFLAKETLPGLEALNYEKNS